MAGEKHSVSKYTYSVMKDKHLQHSMVDNQEKFSYLGTSFLQTYVSRILKMAQIKVALLLADILGFTSFILGWVSNIDSVKSAVLFILGSIYLMIRTYYYFVHNKNKARREQWEQEIREQEHRQRTSRD